MAIHKVQLCPVCKEQKVMHIAQKMCEECREKEKLREREKKMTQKICAYCWKPFLTTRSDKKYCCEECRIQANIDKRATRKLNDAETN